MQPMLDDPYSMIQHYENTTRDRRDKPALQNPNCANTRLPQISVHRMNFVGLRLLKSCSLISLYA